MNRNDLLDELQSMIDNMKALPQNAQYEAVNVYDMSSVLTLLLEILRAE